MKRLALLAVLLAAGCTSAPAPAASPSPPPPVVLPSPVTLPIPLESRPPEQAPFRDVDVVVPAWPRASTQCTAGRVHLGENGGYYPSKAGKTGITAMSAVQVDFAGDGTDQFAVYLLCGEGPEAGGRMIVGYRRVGRGLQLIGRIIGTQDGVQMMEYMRRKDNAIEVLVSQEYSDGGQAGVPSQWRTYALRGNTFRQVGGPTAFPAHPPFVRLVAESSQVVMRTAGAARTGSVTLTIRNEGTATAPVVAVNLRLPESFRPAGTHWSGCTTTELGVYRCPLTNLAAGASTQLSLEVLGPAEPPPPGEFGFTVVSDSPDAYDVSAADTVPLNILFP